MTLRFLVLLLILLAPLAATARDDPYRVLLLNSLGSGQPSTGEFYEGIFQGLNPTSDFQMEIDSESLDLSKINDEAYVRKLIEIFQIKFSTLQPDLIISTYTPALEFLLKHASSVFPDVPIVFSGAEIQHDSDLQLPPNFTGVTIKRDFTGTLELMSRLQPDMQRVALIVGSSRLDKQWEQAAQQALQPYAKKFEFIWLKGLPLRELSETVKTLPSNTGVLYLAQFGDREGNPYIPSFTTQAIADAANAPVYGIWDTLIGRGIVGGRLVSLRGAGLLAGQMGRRILMGEAPATIPVVRTDPNPAIFDARQLRRWNIDESRLPENSQILNRPPSLWEQHSEAIIVTGIFVALLFLWIFTLLLNRTALHKVQASLQDELGERAKAERTSLRLRSRMASIEKFSSLGALASGIAHEVNQPLISIQNYSQAARRYVPVDAALAPKLNELLAEIEQEAVRAGTIIQKTRELLATGHVKMLATAVETLLKETLEGLRAELDNHACQIDCAPITSATMVLADPVQIQLVLVNLLRNAMQAMDALAQGGDKSISISVGKFDQQQIEISIADTGPGIADELREEVFDHLYTSKPQGMGVGLSVCRRIIEAHGGKIWHSANPGGGSIFHFTLPIAVTGT